MHGLTANTHFVLSLSLSPPASCSLSRIPLLISLSFLSLSLSASISHSIFLSFHTLNTPDWFPDPHVHTYFSANFYTFSSFFFNMTGRKKHSFHVFATFYGCVTGRLGNYMRSDSFSVKSSGSELFGPPARRYSVDVQPRCPPP